MYCKKCGKLINPNNKFCTGCGTPVPGASVDTTGQGKDIRPGKPQEPMGAKDLGNARGSKNSKGLLVGLLALLGVLILAIIVLLVLNISKKQEAQRQEELRQEEEAERRERREREAEEEETEEKSPESEASEIPQEAEEPLAPATETEAPEGTESPSLPPVGPREEFIFPDSDSRYLERQELEGLSQRELSIARNEIYARRGRKFNSEELQEYFEKQSWYEPQYTPEEFDAMGGDSFLNVYELANKDLIVEIEEEKGYR